MTGGLSIKLVAFYLITCCLLLAQVAAADNKSESIDYLQAMNLSNQTSLNNTASNCTVFNSSDLNPSEIGLLLLNSLKSNSSEFSPSEFGSSDLNSSEIGLSELNSSDFNSAEFGLSDLSSPEINSSNLNSSESNSSELNSSEFGSFDFNSESAFADLDFSDDYYDYDPYSQILNEPEVISMAFPASDLNGDNATDLLVMNISSDPDTGAFNSEILAFSGADGSTLWQKEYPGALVFATAAGDLNGDGQTDIMVNEILAAASFIPYSGVSALDGRNGTAIWSRPQILAMTFAYPVQDINGDNASEFLVHVFGMDSMNNSIFTSIAQVSGANGTKLDERIFSGALAIEYPAGNFTSDRATDSIAAIYQLNGSMTGEIEEAPINITSTIIEARDGKEHKILWNQRFAGPALAVPVTDLTGDGMDELLVYLIRFTESDSMTCDIAVLRGSDGELLWQQSFAGSLALATAGPDLTGEGQKDLIVYKLGESDSAEVLAVKGDDGRLLWSKKGMIYIPQ